jgi:hypothetical protein
MADGQVRVKGLADFSRDLKRVDTRLAKTLAAANKTVASRVAEKVKPAVRSLAAPASSRTSGGITGRATGRKGKLAFSQAKRSRPLVAHILGADWHMVHGRPVKADSMRSRVWQPHLGSRWSAGDLYGAGPVIVKAADSFIVDEYADAIMDAFAVAFPEKA